MDREGKVELVLHLVIVFGSWCNLLENALPAIEKYDLACSVLVVVWINPGDCLLLFGT